MKTIDTIARSSGNRVYQFFKGRTNLILVLLLAATVAKSARAEVKAEAREITYHLPRLSSVFPQGAQPGTRTRVQILGEYLDRAYVVVANDPSIRGRVL